LKSGHRAGQPGVEQAALSGPVRVGAPGVAVYECTPHVQRHGTACAGGLDVC